MTDYGLRYVIYFIDYSTQFADYPFLVGRIFMFNIEVTDGDASRSPHDERIALTVIQIFGAFFSRQQNVAIYICDGHDGRELARKRKFDYWFDKYNEGLFMKSDNIAVVEDLQIYNSIILHIHNDHRYQILHAFEELNRGIEQKH